MLTGDDVIVGSRFNDRLMGFEGNDRIVGGDANDLIIGDEGNDRLIGGAGTDFLDGKTGANLMQGGAGDDRYRVGSLQDRVVEQSGEGMDIVRSTVNHTLQPNVEKLFLMPGFPVSGISKLSGIGNAGANELRGNSDANLLKGRGGNDFIIGGEGTDRIEGGEGADRVAGGVDRDVFLFRSIQDAGLGAARDTILDFRHNDLIHLAVIDADIRAAADQEFRFIGAGAYSGAGAELRYAGGVLAGDVNGDGRDDFQITIAGGIALTESDFVL